MKYILILTANNGETAELVYETFREAISMRQAFMSMGDYSNAEIVSVSNE